MKNLKNSTYPIYNRLIGFASRKFLLHPGNYRAIRTIFQYSRLPTEDGKQASDLRNPTSSFRITPLRVFWALIGLSTSSDWRAGGSAKSGL